MNIYKELIDLFCERSLTFAAAESLTGGMICEKLTSVPGASAVILGGVVSYAVSVKEKVLGAAPETIEKYGVVSVETAKEMAKGVHSLCSADVAVSATGYAGPGGGDDKAPVGTVCIGVCTGDFCDAGKFDFFENGAISRDEVRNRATDEAILLAIRTVLDRNIKNA